jgi:hypothetical protein
MRWVKGAKPDKASVKRKCEPEEVQERKKRYACRQLEEK